MELRKIVVEENVYLFKISQRVILELNINILFVKIFLNGYKQTPLIIKFPTWDDPSIGSPLNHGFPLKLISGEVEVVNLNRPKYVRKCILYGIIKGWNGTNKLEPLDGIKMLKDFNYDVSTIINE